MAFNSIHFLLSFPIVVLVYYLLPVKLRYIWLLIFSYYFYISWDFRFVLFLLPVTVMTYGTGLVLEETNTKEFPYKSIFRILLILFGICFTMGTLGALKYTYFFIFNFNRFFSVLGVQIEEPQWNLAMPVGISFYSFQALGYLFDIYQKKEHAEKNIFKFALFLAFFPIILSGPIERAGNLLKQLQGEIFFKVENIRYGLLSLAWGIFLKVVVADNLAGIVAGVIRNWQEYRGCEIVLAIVLFGMQIYCDFNGYSQMALGIAKVLGIDVKKNFSAPYLAENIKDFWHRWHISLTSWFTDYLYIPLGGNRKGIIRKYINTLIVFGMSGLWHGASLNFVIWGLLNGFYLIAYDSCQRGKGKKQKRKTRISSNRIEKKFLTFVAVDFAWFFFAMPDMGNAIGALWHTIRYFYMPYFFSEPFWSGFFSTRQLLILIIALVAVLGVDYLEYKGIDFRKVLFEQKKPVRWGAYLFLVFMVIIWGAYGGQYEQTGFIYFNF